MALGHGHKEGGAKAVGEGGEEGGTQGVVVSGSKRVELASVGRHHGGGDGIETMELAEGGYNKGDKEGSATETVTSLALPVAHQLKGFVLGSLGASHGFHGRASAEVRGKVGAGVPLVGGRTHGGELGLVDFVGLGGGEDRRHVNP